MYTCIPIAVTHSKFQGLEVSYKVEITEMKIYARKILIHAGEN